MSTLNESRPFIPVGIAVLTVSDTRTPADDRSGDTLVARIAEAGHRLVGRRMTQGSRSAAALRSLHLLISGFTQAGWTRRLL